MTVGAMLRDARRDAKLTQAELAQEAGTSQSALARYETDAMLPSLPTLERLLRGSGRELELHVTDRAGLGSRPSSIRGQLGDRARRLRQERPRLLALARARGVHDVRVFGSVARGDDNAASDIDLLVTLRPGQTLVDLAGFRRDASELLGAPVDVSTADLLKVRIRSRVLAEAVPL